MPSFPVALILTGLGAQHVDVYTMGQGSHLFERFGHAAICVVDDGRPSRSLCYNYGTANFSTPPEDLGWDLVRGRAQFWVSVWPLPRMVDAYRDSDRDVYRQRLPLTPAQVARVDARLRHEALEENRYYNYHHFDDNCSTRVRGVVDDATGHLLRSNSGRKVDSTFRQLGAARLGEAPWVVVAGQYLAGRRLDEHPSLWQAMFLPSILRREIEQRLGAAPELVSARRGPAFSDQPPPPRGRALAVGAPALVPALASGVRLAGLFRPWVTLTGVVLGTLGCLVWGLALSAEITELSQNEMLLVFWPTDLILGGLGPSRLRAYARFRVGWLLGVSLLAAVGALLQPLTVPLLVPLVSLALIARGVTVAAKRTAGAPGGVGRR